MRGDCRPISRSRPGSSPSIVERPINQASRAGGAAASASGGSASFPSVGAPPRASPSAGVPHGRTRRGDHRTCSRCPGQRDGSQPRVYAGTGGRQIGDLAAHRRANAVPGRHRCPARLQRIDRSPQIGHLLDGRTRRSLFDTAAALLPATRILQADIALRRGIEHPQVAIPAVGHMGDHVPDRPVGQERSSRHIEASRRDAIVQRRQSSRRCSSVATPIHRRRSVHPSLIRRDVDRPRSWQAVRHATRNDRARPDGRQHGAPTPT